MVNSQALKREQPLHCDKTESVLSAIEAEWTKHRAPPGGIVLGLYTHLARLLREEGFVVDTVDGLEILEHCRMRNLPIVDILYALEDRLRAAGYLGGHISLADFRSGDQQVYVFYDSSRVRGFEDLKLKVAVRVSHAPPAQPGA